MARSEKNRFDVHVILPGFTNHVSFTTKPWYLTYYMGTNGTILTRKIINILHFQENVKTYICRTNSFKTEHIFSLLIRETISTKEIFFFSFLLLIRKIDVIFNFLINKRNDNRKSDKLFFIFLINKEIQNISGGNKMTIQ